MNIILVSVLLVAVALSANSSPLGKSRQRKAMESKIFKLRIPPSSQNIYNHFI